MSYPPSAAPGDWYSVLGLAPEATAEQITQAVERLSRQANALAVTAPERARLLRDQVRAIKQDLLSGAESRRRYDDAVIQRTIPTAPAVPVGPAGPPVEMPATPFLPGPPPSPVNVTQGPGLMSRISKFLQTGWTCVGCGYGALPTDKFCPKCGNRVEAGLDGGQQAGGSPVGLAEKRRPATCSNCGVTTAPRDYFCKRCGNSLTSGQ